MITFGISLASERREKRKEIIGLKFEIHILHKRSLFLSEQSFESLTSSFCSQRNDVIEESEREKEGVCERDRERECLCVCVRKRERESRE